MRFLGDVEAAYETYGYAELEDASLGPGFLLGMLAAAAVTLTLWVIRGRAAVTSAAGAVMHPGRDGPPPPPPPPPATDPPLPPPP
jgi:hypothetical protein